MKRLAMFLFGCAVLGGTVTEGLGQLSIVPPTPQVQLRSAAELDQMFAPIALYPDPLLAQLLPAATLPAEIVMGNRYLRGGGDPNGIDGQPWDPSVKALARYPDVLQWMDDNLPWTVAIGQAFLHQHREVMDSIQRLRARARAMGHLQTMPEMNVIAEYDVIEIFPMDPEIMYVPVYESTVVYVHSPSGEPGVSRGKPLRMGRWLNHDFDWPKRCLMVWNREQPRPAGWWSYPPSRRHLLGEAKATVWHRHQRANQTSNGRHERSDTHKSQSTLTVIGGKPSGPERHEPATVSTRSSSSTSDSQQSAAEEERPAARSQSRNNDSHGAMRTRSSDGGQTSGSGNMTSTRYPNAPARSESSSGSAGTGKR